MMHCSVKETVVYPRKHSTFLILEFFIVSFDEVHYKSKKLRKSSYYEIILNIFLSKCWLGVQKVHIESTFYSLPSLFIGIYPKKNRIFNYWEKFELYVCLLRLVLIFSSAVCNTDIKVLFETSLKTWRE